MQYPEWGQEWAWISYGKSCKGSARAPGGSEKKALRPSDQIEVRCCPPGGRGDAEKTNRRGSCSREAGEHLPGGGRRVDTGLELESGQGSSEEFSQVENRWKIGRELGGGWARKMSVEPSGCAWLVRERMAWFRLSGRFSSTPHLPPQPDRPPQQIKWLMGGGECMKSS